jgi:PAS domain S-box-containing protein
MNNLIPRASERESVIPKRQAASEGGSVKKGLVHESVSQKHKLGQRPIAPVHEASRLGDSDSLYRTLVEKNVAAIWHTTAGSDPKTLYMNPAALKLFKLDSLEAAIKLPCARFFSEDTLKLIQANRAARQVSKVDYSYEIPMFTAKGDNIRVLTSSVDIHNDEGLCISTLVTLVDVTAQYALAAKLERSELRFKAIIESSVAGIWQLAAQPILRTEYMNPALLRMLELDSEEEAIAKDPRSYCSPANWLRILGERENRLRGMGTSSYEIEFLSAKGKVGWAQLSPADFYDESGGITSTIVICLDVTERHILQAELEAREHLYKTLTENTITPIWHTRIDGSTIYMNQAAVNLFELDSLAAGDTLNVDDILTEEGLRFLEIETHKRAAGEASVYEMEILTSKKNIRHVMISAAPLISPTGEWLSSIATIVDLTEKKAEEGRREASLAMFRALIANMPEGVLIEDMDRNVVAINDKLLNIFKFETSAAQVAEGSPANATGGEDLVAHLTTDPESFKASIREMRSKLGPTLNMEVNFADGRTCEMDFVPILQENGTRIGQMWKFRDTTERKRIESKLRESEQQYRHLFQENPHPMWVFDTETLAFLEVNLSAVENYGYSREEFLSMTLDDIQKSNQIPRVEEALALPRTGRGNFDGEFMHRAKDGRSITAEVFSNEIEFEGKAAHIVLAQDVTERRKTEAELRRSKAKLQALVENTPDIIVSYDTEMRLLTWNSAFEKLLRDVFHSEIVEGMRLGGHLPQAEVDMREAWMRRGLSGEQFVEQREYNINGELSTIEVSCHPIIENDVITGVMFFNKDITERKRAEIELIEAKDRAEEMNRLKSSFLANMSHEIRTPMTAVLGFAAVIGETTNEPETREFSEHILTGGNRLLKTINDILDLARIEAQRTELQSEIIEIASEIRKTTGLMIALIEQKDLRLTMDVRQKWIYAKLDPHYFGQIITNLVSNAIKFTERGGIVIDVDTEEGESPMAVVRVRDSGIGIQPGYLKKIFEEFSQESHGFSRRYEGTGLGLSIAHRLTELMGGQIAVESTPGLGTTFTLRFPLVNHKPEALEH